MKETLQYTVNESLEITDKNVYSYDTFTQNSAPRMGWKFVTRELYLKLSTIMPVRTWHDGDYRVYVVLYDGCRYLTIPKTMTEILDRRFK